MSLLGEKGASVVAGVADIERGEAQPHRVRHRFELPEDSHEHLNDLSGRNQEVAWERVQEAAQPSDAQIEAEVAAEQEHTTSYLALEMRRLSSDDFIPKYPLRPEETNWYEC